MPQKIIGLDIGTSSLKATLLKGTLGGYQYVSFHEIQYPAEPDLPKGDRLKLAVEELLGEMSLHPDRFVAAMPGNLTSFRTLTLPFTDRKKIEQTLLFEVEGHIPFNIDECIIDHQVIGTTEDTSQVLVAIAKKSDVKDYLELLQQAQADPIVLEPGPISLAHTLRDTMDNIPGVFALLELGAAGSSFCIVSDGKLEMVRFIPFGGNNMTVAVAKALGLSIEDAERVKRETGLIMVAPEEIEDQRAVEVSDAIRKGLAPLLRDLRRTLLTYQSDTGNEVDKVFLSGGASLTGNIDHYLAEELDQHVEPFRIDYDISSKLVQPRTDEAIIPNSLGLSLRGFVSKKIAPINFRRQEFTFKGAGAELRGTAIQVGIFAAILLLLFSLNLYQDYRIHHKKDAEISTQIAAIFSQTFPELKHLNSDRERIASMKSKVDELRTQINMLGTISPGSLSALDILNEISSKIPTELKIDVKELSIDQDKIRVKAETDSFSTMDQIKTKLSECPSFKEVSIADAKVGVDQTTVKFNLKITMG